MLLSTIYYLYNKNKELEYIIQEQAQNTGYLLDSLRQKPDTITITTSRVVELPGKTVIKDNYIIISDTFYTAVPYDTLLIGKSGVVNYNIGISDSIRLQFYLDSIKIQSELFKDSLWKIRTVSLTPGIKLIGYNSIDQSLFQKMENINLDNRTVGIGIYISENNISPGITIRNNHWNYGIYANLLPKNTIIDRISVNIYYNIF